MSDPEETVGRCGWNSDFPSFHSASPRVVRLKLAEFVSDAGPEQIRAWDESIPWLQRECGEVVRCHEEARTYTAILEYELPRDFRRPDVIVLQNGVVVVLELKGRSDASRAALDQVSAYARDLRAYHASCAERPVHAVLIPSRSSGDARVVDGVHVVGPRGVHELLAALAVTPFPPLVTPADFLREDAYAPLPSIVQAARELFHGRPLLRIKRARAATEPALETITTIAHEAARTRTRHLVLLSGVPGSGKTLVGLQLVHAGWLDDLAVERAGGKPSAPAVYLSGNGPLVAVLQDALRDAGGAGRTFVQDIKKYVAHHSRPSAPVPPEHLLVFDEAQRAHDAERVSVVHKCATEQSEPEHMVEFADRIPNWCVIVALIGTGQAIHAGEEGGMPLWRKAIDGSRNPGNWTVHAAATCERAFLRSSVATRWNPALNLDTEIRFHLTPKVHAFVEELLERGDPERASALADELHAGGHRLLLTRDLSQAKEYLRERYEGAPEARFGILASSKDKILPGCGVDNTFQTTKRLRVGPWYNAPSDDPLSCCRLDTVATEFASQGLELDCALLAWGSDLLRENEAWSLRLSRGTRGRVHDPLALRRNVYRVLLTRGRDGTVVFVPKHDSLEPTAEFLIGCGFRSLDVDGL